MLSWFESQIGLPEFVIWTSDNRATMDADDPVAKDRLEKRLAKEKLMEAKQGKAAKKGDDEDGDEEVKEEKGEKESARDQNKTKYEKLRDKFIGRYKTKNELGDELPEENQATL